VFMNCVSFCSKNQEPIDTKPTLLPKTKPFKFYFKELPKEFLSKIFILLGKGFAIVNKNLCKLTKPATLSPSATKTKLQKIEDFTEKAKSNQTVQNNGKVDYARLFNDPRITNKNSLETDIQIQLDELKKKKFAVPADLRLELFKHLMKTIPQTTERVPSKIVRMIFDYDLDYIISALQKWQTKPEQAKKALEKIEEFLKLQQLPDEMSFQEHAYYCFCLSALMSGTDLKDLDKEYDAQLHTMVRGVIHPEGKWSVKSVLEDQRYAKFIFHVSKKGLSTIPQNNYMTSFRIDENSSFCSVRLVAVACDETVEFDGIEDCGSLKVLKHDFIHAGFLKYQFDTKPERYRDCLMKVGIMGEYIRNDPELKANKQLMQQVEAAFFMWNHELTTSIFVDGWPRHLPRRHYLLDGIYASTPQILLRAATKSSLSIPKLFAKEIECEEMILRSVGCTINGLDDPSMSDHDKVKEIMSQLHPGYQYLYEHFNDIYGARSTISVLFNRIMNRLKTFRGI
jgi:hypothetical protein